MDCFVAYYLSNQSTGITMVSIKVVNMVKAKTFMTGRSQAIRLPKEYRFTEDEIYINKIDGVLMVVEREKLWGIFEGSLDKFTDDFMTDRGVDIKDNREQL